MVEVLRAVFAELLIVGFVFGALVELVLFMLDQVTKSATLTKATCQIRIPRPLAMGVFYPLFESSEIAAPNNFENRPGHERAQ